MTTQQRVTEARTRLDEFDLRIRAEKAKRAISQPGGEDMGVWRRRLDAEAVERTALVNTLSDAQGALAEEKSAREAQEAAAVVAALEADVEASFHRAGRHRGASEALGFSVTVSTIDALCLSRQISTGPTGRLTRERLASWTAGLSQSDREALRASERAKVTPAPFNPVAEGRAKRQAADVARAQAVVAEKAAAERAAKQAAEAQKTKTGWSAFDTSVTVSQQLRAISADTAEKIRDTWRTAGATAGETALSEALES